ncbi:hypothetical protein K340107D12_48560 [Blautia parvula]|uniref:Uncharacterized protein n=1 Tax=Blautia parvula TaxID=2877527 RepID=A0ABQ0BZU0_9FIRM
MGAIPMMLFSSGGTAAGARFLSDIRVPLFHKTYWKQYAAKQQRPEDRSPPGAVNKKQNDNKLPFTAWMHGTYLCGTQASSSVGNTYNWGSSICRA